MVKNNKAVRHVKRGIAMVELIFALVIMGIVLLSAPMLIQQSIKSSNVALQQEAIAAIASHTGILLSKHWDEGDTNLSGGVAPIITLTTPVADSPFNFAGIDFDNNTSGRTYSIADQNITASALGSDTADRDDIDDYNNLEINLTVFNHEESSSGELGDYIDTDIIINTSVSYANDRPIGVGLSQNTDAGRFNTPALGANQSHIKFVEATLTTNSPVQELNKTIVLHAFSCNLGTYSLGGSQY
ncbi:MAG: Unknown protein [uncultured Sulfurovum sp.]|uniref:Uncharacterized protein n=1 Tax=uncultured Sulfurovum sp. TaxID=269237 RepID=A0A6S6SSL8_9BACT|nr:MAG: Unknown protein [uncultured Sulfurovum sp.]